ncbi:single-stranded DNA-binding protein [Campylobacter fetus subsp. venerealis]|uniref:single-stranded DNA-binding protein n=1 Tax=Campylobacter fetus TaxID=196 RepID=UPI000818C77E|nr:single-stranded DNA-binding protein [Campylobacter fetus]MBK3498189.1 single-stranded DNA-binding protein [Campylobacter fetus subsp. venerealis]MBK3502179.1 single-stranded DNA-binding protein [Campylobacter fetus subsp. venerealis]OCS16824.1 single-stranded DNA-binding protein [Campylobacter fetus subsp. venerealis]
MNKVNLCGYLGRDFEMRYANNGNAIATNSLAITKRYKDANGNKVEHTDWIPIKLFGKTAEVANQYFRQGSQFLCSGEITTGSYQDANGKERYVWEVTVREFHWLNQKDEQRDVQNNTQNLTQPAENLPQVEQDMPEMQFYADDYTGEAR